MKSFFKKILEKILYLVARVVLNKYRPEVIGVTGSVGKTSAKEAIYAVLSPHFLVRQNSKNYNNEIGLPLTIIGAEAGGRSVFLWLEAISQALRLILRSDQNYPKILILEMGVDRIGDMKYLTSLAPCRIGVVTSVAPVHLEFFKSLEKIAKEKSVIVSHLDKNGWAILNSDNNYVKDMAQATKARVLNYGLNEGADIRAVEINLSQNLNRGSAGLNFKLVYEGSTVPVLLPDVLGEHLIYAALAGAAVGIAYGLNLVEISENLKSFKAPVGRMHLIGGIKNSLIIDDSYNASPQSMLAALNTLGKLKSQNKKIAVLGDMLELGDYSELGHRQVGEAVVKNGIDALITVGERAKDIAAAALKSGLTKENVFSFSGVEEAGKFVQERLETGDLILVKASQGMRLEKVTKEIMAEPLKAKELLVRQDKPWL